MVARLLIALAVAGGALAGGLALTRRAAAPAASAPERVPGELRPATGPNPGWAVLAFAAPLCAACRRTPGVVAEALGAALEALDGAPHGIAVRQVDVREHPDLVDHLGVDRTPTVAVLDPEGQVRLLHAGNPEPEAIREALAEALEDGAADGSTAPPETSDGVAA